VQELFNPAGEPLLTASDLQRMLKVSRATSYNLAATGRIPSVRIPCFSDNGRVVKHLVRFRPSDIHDFIEKHRNPAT
jgi:hypothetical protein